MGTLLDHGTLSTLGDAASEPYSGHAIHLREASAPLETLFAGSFVPPASREDEANFADPTGVLRALASGHQDISAQLLTGGPWPLLRLFSNYEDLGLARELSARRISTPPIFKEDAARVLAVIRAMPALMMPGAKLVRSIQLGQLAATTRNDSEWIGIPGGTAVQLQLLLVEGSPALVELRDVRGLPDLVQEVVTAVTAEANRELAEELLDRHLHVRDAGVTVAC